MTDVLVDDNNGTLTKYLNGAGIDNKLKLTANGVAKYFVQDHLGSTNALTDVNGAITESTSYDSFGNATNQLSTRYQFTGREYDSFTGLHYYRARFYDAKLGRFISEDPIGFDGGNVNLYGYVWNSPNNFIDPSGMSVLIKLGKFITRRGLPYLMDTGKKLTMKQAQNVRRNGGNVIVEGKNAQKTAQQIETGAFKNDVSAGDQLRHDPHGDAAGFLPHYQTNKYDGHSFYKYGAMMFAPNIIRSSESSCTTNSQFASAVLWDGASLIDPIGLTDAIDAGTGMDGGKGGFRGLLNFVTENAPVVGIMKSLIF